MSRATLVLVGGFLGAGKTSLILAASRMLRDRGVRVAAILNDQGGALVDTALANQHGMAVEQVTGGCFCCRFHELTASAERLLAAEPAVIFAEPVGSCTDVTATVVQPLMRMYGGRVHVAPFTVLVDPGSAIGNGDADLAYLYEKQMEEGDLVRMTKADVYPEAQLSARTGQGIAEWLREVLEGTRMAGSNVVEVDYARYGRAEAALGWLNFKGTLRGKALAPAEVVGPLLDRVVGALGAAGIAIAHCKVIGCARTGYVKAAVTSGGREPDVEGDLTASPAREHEVLLNLRALGDPEALRGIVEEALSEAPGKWVVRSIDSLRPAPPVPVHRVV